MVREMDYKLVLYFSLIFLLLFPVISSADTRIQFYKIFVSINDDRSTNVSLTMTFESPQENLSMKIIGRVDDFTASSNAGPVHCDVDVSGISTIDCDMNLTENKREVELSFKTDDFVRGLNGMLYFNSEFSPNFHVQTLSASVKLPKNHLLVGEDISSSVLSYPENATAFISGDTIVVVWSLSDIPKTTKLQFEILYEEISPPIWFQLRMRHFILFGVVLAVVIGVIVVRHLRSSEKLVLSVLDEYERQIIGIISEEGEIKQKRVVERSGLSKAKVSRVVNDLADRGLIEIERRGRSNKLRMSKGKFKL